MRSVNTLLAIEKLLERVVYIQMVDYISDKNSQVLELFRVTKRQYKVFYFPGKYGWIKI